MEGQPGIGNLVRRSLPRLRLPIHVVLELSGFRHAHRDLPCLYGDCRRRIHLCSDVVAHGVYSLCFNVHASRRPYQLHTSRRNTLWCSCACIGMSIRCSSSFEDA